VSKRPWLIAAAVVLAVLAVVVIVCVLVMRRHTTTTTTTTSYPFDSHFRCNSTHQVRGLTDMAKKGMCLDDTTFADCSGRLTAEWPNSEAPVKLMRVFKPCVPNGNCDEHRREADWNNLVQFVKTNNVTVLMGNEVSPCTWKQDDAAEWRQTLELLKRLGKEHVFGIAVGNELDLRKKEDHPCMPDFWKGGYLELLEQRAADLEKIGFGSVPLTAVLTPSVLGNDERPFRNTSDEGFATFYSDVYKRFGKSRWAWAFNVYPFWGGSGCGADYGLDASKRFDELAGTLRTLRQSMTNITGNTDDILWMTETGWSSKSMGDRDVCPGKPYSTLENERAYYEKFLQWNLSIGEGLAPPEVAFYFTMRDTNGEFFGLMDSCDATECKIQGTSERHQLVLM